jgi:hypothetical protein
MQKKNKSRFLSLPCLRIHIEIGHFPRHSGFIYHFGLQKAVIPGLSRLYQLPWAGGIQMLSGFTAPLSKSHGNDKRRSNLPRSLKRESQYKTY